MYEHVLVGLDGSPTAERVLEHARALASAFGSTITLLRATIAPETLIAETTNPGQTGGDFAGMTDPLPILEAERAAALAYLTEVAGRLQQDGLEVNVEHLDGPPADAIVERAAALGASLILLTTHGRGGLNRLVFGSVADSVLRHAPCAVLLVRVNEADRQKDEALGQ